MNNGCGTGEARRELAVVAEVKINSLVLRVLLDAMVLLESEHMRKGRILEDSKEPGYRHWIAETNADRDEVMEWLRGGSIALRAAQFSERVKEVLDGN